MPRRPQRPAVRSPPLELQRHPHQRLLTAEGCSSFSATRSSRSSEHGAPRATLAVSFVVSGNVKLSKTIKSVSKGDGQKRPKLPPSQPRRGLAGAACGVATKRKRTGPFSELICLG